MKFFLGAVIVVCSAAISVLPALVDGAASGAAFGRVPSNQQHFGAEPGALRSPGLTLAPRPTLMAKRKDYFLHRLHALAPNGYSPKLYRDGTALSHTSRATGEMTLLYSSGNISFPTRRMSYAGHRILGATWDDTRIYVCVWGTGQVFADQLPQDFTLDQGKISLLIFRGSDGTLRQELPIRLDQGLSKVAAEDNLEAGPLRLMKNGVSYFHQTFTFDKERLVPEK